MYESGPKMLMSFYVNESGKAYQKVMRANQSYKGSIIFDNIIVCSVFYKGNME